MEHEIRNCVVLADKEFSMIFNLEIQLLIQQVAGS